MENGYEKFTFYYVPENNHGCAGHRVTVKSKDGENFEVVSESNCCMQSGSCKYKIGEDVILPEPLWLGVAMVKNNYGNTLLEPSDLIRDPTNARFPETSESVSGDNDGYNEKYTGELERYNRKIGMKWDTYYA
jgi:hypothetical protein